MPEELQRFVETKVAEGDYKSAVKYVQALLQREVSVTRTLRLETAEKEDLRQRELAFQQELVDAGILLEKRLPPPSIQSESFQPVKIQGPPLSETVIRDRR